jgi:hypothetical protein
MRWLAGAMIPFAASLIWIACDESTDTPDPTCEPNEPCVPPDGGAPPDGASPVPPSNDSGFVDPAPFDAGTTTNPTCKGLFELCSGQECCSPYACTNGTCR